MIPIHEFIINNTFFILTLLTTLLISTFSLFFILLRDKFNRNYIKTFLDPISKISQIFAIIIVIVYGTAAIDVYDYNQTKIHYHSLYENYKNLKELKDLELQIKNDKLNTKDQELQKLDIEITNKKNYIKNFKNRI